MQTFLIITHFIGIFLVLALGLFVIRQRRELSNILLSLICLSIGIWFFGVLEMLLHSTSVSAIAFWGRFIFFGVIFLTILCYHLSLIITKTDQPIRLYAGYAIFAVFLILSQTKYFAEGVYSYGYGGFLRAEPLLGVFLIFFFIYALFLFNNLLAYHNKEQFFLHRAKAILFFTSWVFLGLASFSFLHFYGYNMQSIPNLAVLPFGILVFSFIVKYDFLGTHFNIRNLFSYFFSLFIIYALIFFLTLLEFVRTDKFYQIKSLVFSFSIAIIFMSGLFWRLHYVSKQK